MNNHAHHQEDIWESNRILCVFTLCVLAFIIAYSGYSGYLTYHSALAQEASSDV
jgi:hypothetical protein